MPNGEWEGGRLYQEQIDAFLYKRVNLNQRFKERKKQN